MSDCGGVKYRTIVADPPWDYPEGFAGGHHGSPSTGYTPTVTAPLPYSPLSVAEIRALTIPAAPDARLFLWTTNRYLPDAFDVLLGAWDFAYRQTLVWRKRNGNLPSHIAPNAEFVLVAVRGAPERIGTMRSPIIETGRATSHSAKPEAFLDLVESVSPGPYLDMFSRRARLGWDTWGDEALHGMELLA